MSPRISEDDRHVRRTHRSSRPTEEKKPATPPVRPAAERATADEHPKTQPTDRSRRDARAIHAANPAAQQLRTRAERTQQPHLERNEDGSYIFHTGNGDANISVRQDEHGRTTIRDRNTNRTYRVDGPVTIEGGDGNDRIDVRSNAGRFAVNNRITVNGNGGEDNIKVQTRDGGFGNDVNIRGGGGDDRINAGGSTASVNIRGGGGNDRLIGGRGNDRLIGGRGNDRITGGAGNDRLEGRKGDDRLGGGSGNDVITGGSGRDRLNGGRGGDIIDTDRSDTRIDAGARDGARDTIVQREGGVKPVNLGPGDRIVQYDAKAVQEFKDEHPGIRVDGDDAEIARLLETPEGRRQLENLPPEGTLHVGPNRRQNAVDGALAEPGSHHMFLNDDNILQDVSIRDAGERNYDVTVRGLDQASAAHPTTFRANFDEGVDPRMVLPSIINDYSESPHELRTSVRTMNFNAGHGPPVTSTANPNDFAAANATNGTINFFDGAGNLWAFDHEAAHLIGQDRGNGDYVPDGYETAAQSDGNFVSPYAEEASSSTGYTEDFADAWAQYNDAVDGGPEAIEAYRRQYPNRAAWFEANFPRPTDPF